MTRVGQVVGACPFCGKPAYRRFPEGQVPKYCGQVCRRRSAAIRRALKLNAEEERVACRAWAASIGEQFARFRALPTTRQRMAERAKEVQAEWAEEARSG